MDIQLKDIFKLSIAERILLVEEIWSSIAAEPKEDSIALTEAQKKEIDRRIELYRNGQTKTYSWEEVKASLRR